jgi:hypothetical protein
VEQEQPKVNPVVMENNGATWLSRKWTKKKHHSCLLLSSNNHVIFIFIFLPLLSYQPKQNACLPICASGRWRQFRQYIQFLVFRLWTIHWQRATNTHFLTCVFDAGSIKRSPTEPSIVEKLDDSRNLRPHHRTSPTGNGASVTNPAFTASYLNPLLPLVPARTQAAAPATCIS